MLVVKKEGQLLHPVTDALMMGGLAILLFLAVQFSFEKSANTYELSWIMFYLGFAVNFPHFMASYVLLYKDSWGRIFQDWKYTWAGIVAPIILGTVLWFLAREAIASNDHRVLGYMVNVLYFSVGHHYVKQTYGCMMVSSAKTKFYLSKLESRALLIAMYSIWILSFINSHAYTSVTHNFYGISYRTLGLDKLWLDLSYALTLLSGAVFCFLMVKRYRKEKRTIPLSGWLAFGSIFVWYIPAFYHPVYFLMIPFFHSLQYLLFIGAYARNRALEDALKHPLEQRNRAFLMKLGLFTLIIVLSGYLAWEYIPKFLDTTFPAHQVLGPTIFMFSFQIFLNLHHYVIDNVIWRKEHPTVKYL